MSYRRRFVLLTVCSATGVTAYFLAIFCSYLVVPPVAPPYEILVPEWQRDGYYTLRPGRYENPQFGVAYTINRHGFRGPEFEVEKRRYRIICVGESSTIGIESSELETWPARLQHYLGAQVEVINAGVGGSGSREHLAMLRDLLRHDPDLVLYYAGFNDHDILALKRYPGPDLWKSGRLDFLRHWFLYKRVQIRMLLLPIADIEDLVTWSNAWARTYGENLAAMHREAADARVRFVAISQVLQPMSRRDILMRKSEALAIEQRIIPPGDFVDVQTAFESNEEPLFYDEVHLTPHGNDVLARATAGALQQRGILPSSAVSP